MKNIWNPGKWVLFREYSERAFWWIPTWHGLDGFQKSLRPYALDERSLSIGRANMLFQGPSMTITGWKQDFCVGGSFYIRGLVFMNLSIYLIDLKQI